MGWLWVASSLFWGLILINISLSHDALGALGSLFISWSTPTLVVALAVNIGFALMYLIMGAYIESFAGSHTRQFLIICGIVSAVTFLGILPIIALLYSLYGLYAYQKLKNTGSLTFKRTSLRKQYQRQATIALALLGVAFITGLIGIAKANHTVAASAGTTQSGKSRYFNSGSCLSKTSTVCVYRDTAAGYQVAFPITAIGKTPTLFDSVLATGSPFSALNNTASYVQALMSGYLVEVYSFKNPTTNVLNRLEQVRNNDNLDCGTNPETDTLTTYLSLPAISTNIAGMNSFPSAPCHFYATTIAKGNKVYEISGTDIDTKDYLERVSQAGYQTFLASFKFTD